MKSKKPTQEKVIAPKLTQPEGMKPIKLPSNWQYIIPGIAWLVYPLFMPLYRPLDYTILAGISVALYFAGHYLLPKKTEFTRGSVSYDKTDNKNADVLLRFGGIYLNKIMEYNGEVKHEDLRLALNGFIRDIRALYDIVYETPSLALHIKQVVNFYAAGLTKMLTSYKEIVADVKSDEEDEQRARKYCIRMCEMSVEVFAKVNDLMTKGIEYDIETDIPAAREMISMSSRTSEDALRNLGMSLEEEMRKITERRAREAASAEKKREDSEIEAIFEELGQRREIEGGEE